MAITPQEMGALIGTVFVGTSVLVLVRAIAHKIENNSKQPKIPPASSERMERMERAIDTIAVEVERISESQRFLTKLLAEREGADAAALPRGGSPREGAP